MLDCMLGPWQILKPAGKMPGIIGGILKTYIEGQPYKRGVDPSGMLAKLVKTLH